MKTTQSMSNRNNFDSSTEQLDFSGNTIPIPQNFKCFQENQDLFIVNQEDGSIFKWVQVIGVLKPNDLTGKRKTEYGRRNFNGTFEAKFDNNNYHETRSQKFYIKGIRISWIWIQINAVTTLILKNENKSHSNSVRFIFILLLNINQFTQNNFF